MAANFSVENNLRGESLIVARRKAANLYKSWLFSFYCKPFSALKEIRVAGVSIIYKRIESYSLEANNKSP